DWSADQVMAPRDRNTFLIESGRELVIAHRTEVVMPGIVFTRPCEFHRCAGRLGNQRRFDREIGMKLPAESAAEEWNVDFDLFLRDLERGSERLRGSGRMLDRRPELAGVALH